MNLRILPILGFVAWCFFCQRWYVCRIKQRCETPVAMSKIADETPQNTTSEIAEKPAEKPAAEKPAAAPPPAPAKPIESEKPAGNYVKTIDDHIVIYYDYNKLDKQANAEVDDYLQNLAEQLKSSGQKVTLVGHTDAVGDSKTNVVVSERRAKNIRDVLKANGVNAKQIITKGMGESKAIGSNDNPEGRRKNRRVEVFIGN
jgi:OmpA-OmpF porin, OOP family